MPHEAADSFHAEWCSGAGVGSSWGGQARDVDGRICFALTYDGRNISTSAVCGGVCGSDSSATEEWTDGRRSVDFRMFEMRASIGNL